MDSWKAVVNDPAWRKKKNQKRRQGSMKRTEAKKKQLRHIRESFYASREWRVLRYKALKLHGARCQCCGVSAADGARLNVDHIKPRSSYPGLALDLENLQVLCAWCNLGKGRWDSTDWRTF